MAAKSKAPKPEPVGVGARLRKAHTWFEDLATRTKDEAIKGRRKKERAKGPQLSPEELTKLADEMEEIQRALNPLENRRKEILEKLLPHWGHTGIEEIESRLGKTLISASFELCIETDVAKRALGDTLWQKVTARILQAPLLLAEGKRSTQVRDAITKALAVRKLKVSVTPPSSRRAKSGETGEAEEEAA
jgi:hypothetical protein